MCIWQQVYRRHIEELPWWLRRQSICLQWGRPGFNFWVEKIPWRGKWQSTPALLPGKSHGWRSLIGYSPWDRKESDTTEQLHFHFHTGGKSTCWGSWYPWVGLTRGMQLYTTESLKTSFIQSTIKDESEVKWKSLSHVRPFVTSWTV